MDGPTVSGWTSLARRYGLVIVGGLCECAGGGRIANTAVVVDAGGVRAEHGVITEEELEAGGAPLTSVGTRVEAGSRRAAS
ncbi:MAG: hypothetical protein ACRDN9_05280 [Streptosporangiaceae bacterium]